MSGKGVMADIAKGSAATILLFLVYATVPLVGLVPGLCTPFPVAFYRLKDGRGAGAAIFALSLLCIALLVGPAGAAVYLLFFGLISVLLPEFLVRGKSGARSAALAVTVVVLVAVACAAVFGVVRGVNPDSVITRGITEGLAQSAVLYEKAGAKGEELEAIKSALVQSGEVAGRIYPALTVIALILIAGISLSLLTRGARRLTIPLNLGPFSRYKNNELLVWIVIASGFSLLVPEPTIFRVALNIFIVGLFLYFIQGLAVLVHFLNRFKVSNLIRTVIFVLLAIQPYLAVALALLGLFDLWGDFRSPKQQANL